MLIISIYINRTFAIIYYSLLNSQLSLVACNVGGDLSHLLELAAVMTREKHRSQMPMRNTTIF